MSILNSLSKKDCYWREVAFKITGSKILADDIVQNMYIKIHRANPEKWNYSYVILTIYNLFKDYKKGCKFNKEVIEDKIEDVTISNYKSYTDKEILILNQLEVLTDYEKELLLMNYDCSIGVIAKEKNKSRPTIHRHLKDIRKKILGEDLEGYSNRRLKYRNNVR